MKKLLSEKPLNKISVKDITDECEINRKTYYYHFKDKYDLVHWIFMNDFYGSLDITSINTIWEFLEPLCVYFYDNRQYYVNAFEEKDVNSFSQFFSELIKPLFKKHFEDVFSKSEFYSLYADYTTTGFIMLFEIWLKNYEHIKPDKFLKIMKNYIHVSAKHVVDQDDVFLNLNTDDVK